MTLVTLRAGDAQAVVALRGAELLGWQVGDTPLLWAAEPAIWAETAPILFPIVGWTRGGQIRVDGATYPLGVHGFARSLPFVVAEQEAVRVMLVATATPDTLRAYPFAFALAVTHTLTPSALRTELVVRNVGAAAMPYACGLHPGFRWPFAGGQPDDYAIEFAQEERADVPVISADGLFTERTRPIPLVGTRLPLTPTLFVNEALCLLHARSRALRFVNSSGAAIALALDDFPHLALWSRPPGRFLCVEAWTGYGDPVGFAGELAAKPSMRLLAPGATARHAAEFAFSPA